MHLLRCKSLLVCLGLLTFGTCAVTAASRRVLVIGCDGMGAIAFARPERMPNVMGLMRSGASTLKARAVMPTSSSANWGSMIMGAGPEQHGITSNDWETNKFTIAPTTVGPGGIFPTIFGILREQRPGAKIACIYDWEGFGRLLERQAPNVLEHVKGSPAAARRASELIRQMQPDFLFVHLDEVDHAGHGKGFGTEAYFAAVEEVDKLIGQLVTALRDARLLDETLIVLIADHGGKGTKHGGESMAELEVPFILSGPGVRRGYAIRAPVNVYDLAPTVAWVLGLKVPEAWIGRAAVEAFESR